jgi:hypothetical protein
LFDATRYDREVLRPLRGTHGHLPQGDLLARYAVDPGMDAAELARHLAEIRAWWRERARAPDFRAQVCKLLIQADEELRRTTGAAMDDPAWWREQAHLSPREPGPEEPATTAGPAPMPPSPARGWPADVRAQFWSALATLDRTPAAAPATTAQAAPAPDEEQPGHRGLTVRPVGADGDRCTVEVTWSGPDAVIRCSPRPTPFAAGAVVSREEADGWGAELPGEPVRRDGELVLHAVVGTGYLVYQPFEPAGGRWRAGRPAGLIVAAPVQRLRIERDGDGATASWVWPPGSSTASAEFAGERRVVTRAEYTAGNGLRLAGAHAGGELVVRAYTRVGDGTAHSPPAVATLGPAPAVIAYDLRRRRRLGGTDMIVTVTADRDCTGVDLDVVLAVGEFMPLSPDQGTRVAHCPGLMLAGGTPLRLTLSWPGVASGDRPYWLRCFFRAPFEVSVEDPPIDHMRTR